MYMLFFLWHGADMSWSWQHMPHSRLTLVMYLLFCHPCSHRMEQRPKSCALDLMLVYEKVEEDMATLTPVNTMRNYALLQARTPLVAAIDVDMLISKPLSKYMADPLR